MPWRSTGCWDVLKVASRSCGHEPDNTHLVRLLCLSRFSRLQTYATQHSNSFSMAMRLAEDPSSPSAPLGDTVHSYCDLSVLRISPRLLGFDLLRTPFWRSSRSGDSAKFAYTAFS